MIRRHSLAVCLLLSLAACASAARVLYPVNEDAFQVKTGDYRLDPKHAVVIFRVNHLGFSEFYGQFRALSGRLSFSGATPEDSEVAIEIDTGSIDTRSTELDGALKAKSMFNSETFPAARFVSTQVRQTGDKTGKVDGLLTIRDITKPIILNVTFGGSGTHPLSGKKTVGFNATGSFLRSEFGLRDWLPLVGDEVALVIEAEFVRD